MGPRKKSGRNPVKRAYFSFFEEDFHFILPAALKATMLNSDQAFT